MSSRFDARPAHFCSELVPVGVHISLDKPHTICMENCRYFASMITNGFWVESQPESYVTGATGSTPERVEGSD